MKLWVDSGLKGYSLGLAPRFVSLSVFRKKGFVDLTMLALKRSSWI